MIAEDSLGYPSGKLADATGGDGWSGAWHGFGFTVDSGGAATTSVGGQETNEAIRKLATPIAFGDTFYFSTVITLNDLTGQFFAALDLYQIQNNKPGGMVGIGITNGFAFAQGPAQTAEQGKSVEVGRSGSFTLVGRVHFEGNGGATLDLWVNPQGENDTSALQSFPNLVFPEQGPFTLAKLHYFNKGSGGAVTFSGIKISSSWPLTK